MSDSILIGLILFVVGYQGIQFDKFKNKVDNDLNEIGRKVNRIERLLNDIKKEGISDDKENT